MTLLNLMLNLSNQDEEINITVKDSNSLQEEINYSNSKEFGIKITI